MNPTAFSSTAASPTAPTKAPLGQQSAQLQPPHPGMWRPNYQNAIGNAMSPTRRPLHAQSPRQMKLQRIDLKTSTTTTAISSTHPSTSSSTSTETLGCMPSFCHEVLHLHQLLQDSIVLSTQCPGDRHQMAKAYNSAIIDTNQSVFDLLTSDRGHAVLCAFFDKWKQIEKAPQAEQEVCVRMVDSLFRSIPLVIHDRRDERNWFRFLDALNSLRGLLLRLLYKIPRQKSKEGDDEDLEDQDSDEADTPAGHQAESTTKPTRNTQQLLFFRCQELEKRVSFLKSLHHKHPWGKWSKDDDLGLFHEATIKVLTEFWQLPRRERVNFLCQVAAHSQPEENQLILRIILEHADKENVRFVLQSIHFDDPVMQAEDGTCHRDCGQNDLQTDEQTRNDDGDGDGGDNSVDNEQQASDQDQIIEKRRYSSFSVDLGGLSAYDEDEDNPDQAKLKGWRVRERGRSPPKRNRKDGSYRQQKHHSRKWSTFGKGGSKHQFKDAPIEDRLARLLDEFFTEDREELGYPVIEAAARLMDQLEARKHHQNNRQETIRMNSGSFGPRHLSSRRQLTHSRLLGGIGLSSSNLMNLVANDSVGGERTDSGEAGPVDMASKNNPRAVSQLVIATGGSVANKDGTNASPRDGTKGVSKSYERQYVTKMDELLGLLQALEATSFQLISTEALVESFQRLPLFSKHFQTFVEKTNLAVGYAAKNPAKVLSPKPISPVKGVVVESGNAEEQQNVHAVESLLRKISLMLRHVMPLAKAIHQTKCEAIASIEAIRSELVVVLDNKEARATEDYSKRKSVLWRLLRKIGLGSHLDALGLIFVVALADKHRCASCGAGVIRKPSIHTAKPPEVALLADPKPAEGVAKDQTAVHDPVSMPKTASDGDKSSKKHADKIKTKAVKRRAVSEDEEGGNHQSHEAEDEERDVRDEDDEREDMQEVNDEHYEGEDDGEGEDGSDEEEEEEEDEEGVDDNEEGLEENEEEEGGEQEDNEEEDDDGDDEDDDDDDNDNDDDDDEDDDDDDVDKDYFAEARMVKKLMFQVMRGSLTHEVEENNNQDEAEPSREHFITDTRLTAKYDPRFSHIKSKLQTQFKTKSKPKPKNKPRPKGKKNKQISGSSHDSHHVQSIAQSKTTSQSQSQSNSHAPIRAPRVHQAHPPSQPENGSALTKASSQEHLKRTRARKKAVAQRSGKKGKRKHKQVIYDLATLSGKSDVPFILKQAAAAVPLQNNPNHPFKLAGLSILLRTIATLYRENYESSYAVVQYGNRRMTFSEFLYDWHIRKYGLKSLAQQHLLKFILSLQKRRKKSFYCELCLRFLGIYRPLGYHEHRFIFSLLDKWSGGTFCGATKNRVVIDAHHWKLSIPFAITTIQDALAERFGIYFRSSDSLITKLGTAALENDDGFAREEEVIQIALDEFANLYQRITQIMKAGYVAGDVNGDEALEYDEFVSVLWHLAPNLPDRFMQRVFSATHDLMDPRRISYKRFIDLILMEKILSLSKNATSTNNNVDGGGGFSPRKEARRNSMYTQEDEDYQFRLLEETWNHDLEVVNAALQRISHKETVQSIQFRMHFLQLIVSKRADSKTAWMCHHQIMHDISRFQNLREEQIVVLREKEEHFKKAVRKIKHANQLLRKAAYSLPSSDHASVVRPIGEQSPISIDPSNGTENATATNSELDSSRETVHSSNAEEQDEESTEDQLEMNSESHEPQAGLHETVVRASTKKSFLLQVLEKPATSMEEIEAMEENIRNEFIQTADASAIEDFKLAMETLRQESMRLVSSLTSNGEFATAQQHQEHSALDSPKMGETLAPLHEEPLTASKHGETPDPLDVEMQNPPASSAEQVPEAMAQQ